MRRVTSVPLHLGAGGGRHRLGDVRAMAERERRHQHLRLGGEQLVARWDSPRRRAQRGRRVHQGRLRRPHVHPGRVRALTGRDQQQRDRDPGTALRGTGSLRHEPRPGSSGSPPAHQLSDPPGPVVLWNRARRGPDPEWGLPRIFDTIWIAGKSFGEDVVNPSTMLSPKNRFDSFAPFTARSGDTAPLKANRRGSVTAPDWNTGAFTGPISYQRTSAPAP